MTDIIFGILDICHDMIAVICGILLLRAVGGYRERSRVASIITLSITFAVSVLTSTLFFRLYYQFFGNGMVYEEFEDTAETITTFTSLIIWLFVPLIVLRVTKRIRSLMLLFALMSVTMLPDSLVIVCLNGTEISAFADDLIDNILVIVCYGIITAALAVYSRRNELMTVKNVFDNTPVWMYVLLFLLSLFAYSTTLLEDITYRMIITVITVIGVVAAMIYLIRHISILAVEQTSILKKLDDQQTGYEKMLKSDEELRHFRHDYKNHMLVVTSLLNAGKDDEAAEYLEKIKVVSGIAGRQFSTGNFVVDAILNNKNSLAEEFEIHITFNGKLPEEGIDNADLCTVAGNLIDNAIEGTKRYDGSRYIRMDASVRNGFLALSFTNPVNKKVEIKNNRIRTTKEDSKNHGIGLKNVQNIAEKYGGVMLLSCTDTEFTADVSMKLAH